MKESIETIIALLKKHNCRSDICRELGWCVGGASFKKLNKIIKEHDVNISHFVKNKSYLKAYPKIIKTCPVCKEPFEEKQGACRERTTCSRSCSNTLYRSGSNNGNYVEDRTKLKGRDSKTYRKLFTKEEFYCRKCNYNEYTCSIDIHHIDENKYNNNKNNLIPLCRNCHSALHSGHWKIEDILSVDT